jgi:hypothetical protein
MRPKACSSAASVRSGSVRSGCANTWLTHAIGIARSASTNAACAVSVYWAGSCWSGVSKRSSVDLNYQHMNASVAERHYDTSRGRNKRKVRKILAFSKARRYHWWMRWLSVTRYNFCRGHSSWKMQLDAQGQHRSPAMAARVAAGPFSSPVPYRCVPALTPVGPHPDGRPPRYSYRRPSASAPSPCSAGQLAPAGYCRTACATNHRRRGHRGPHGMCGE